MIQTNSTINNHEIIFEAGKIAAHANGVIVKAGGTVLLCTAVIGNEVFEECSPLTVQYIEKFSAVNKIPGGYKKREGAPGDAEILISRIIDRAFRPLMDKTMANEVQLTVQVLSYDGYACDVLAIAGCSLALNLAGVLNKLVAATKIANDAINTRNTETAAFDFFVALSADQNEAEFETKILMLEYMGKDLESGLLKTILNPVLNLSIKESMNAILELSKKAQTVAVEFLKAQAKFLKQAKQDSDLGRNSLQSLFGSQAIKCCDTKKVTLKKFESDFKEIESKFFEIIKLESLQKRDLEFHQLKKAFLKKFHDHEKLEANYAFNYYAQKSFSSLLFESKLRFDGRKFDQLREISMEAKILPDLHGSALFTRGDTQALVSVTLGGQMDQQLVESINGYYKEKFMLHYNFLPYAVGQVGKISLSRREIGHAELAKKAFISVLPARLEHTVRVISDVTSSNGSSSMATVCASSLALFDAGILDTHVAGISIGLLEKQPAKKGGKVAYKLLSDINAFEDQFGCMDFKIAGTKNAITAMQLDIKTDGITEDILEKSMKLAVKHIKEILAMMVKTIKKPTVLIQNKKEVINVHRSKIKLVIGKGGSVINALCKEFDLKIDVQNSGKIFVTGPDEVKIKQAIEKINAIVQGDNRRN